MVHALNEIRRVLVNDGSLIDLRPILDRWPIEVSSNREVLGVGRAIDLPSAVNDDGAANQAMEEAEKRGWFVRRSEEVFPFFYYWDSPKEMQEYIDETWNDVIQIEDNLWNNLRSKWATANADARVRIRLKMMISALQKKALGRI